LHLDILCERRPARLPEGTCLRQGGGRGQGLCGGGRRHAAWPRIRAPSAMLVGVGVHPDASRASSISSASGRWSHTETPFTPPSQVVSNTRYRFLCPAGRTTTSWLYSSWITTSTTSSPLPTTSARVRRVATLLARSGGRSTLTALRHRRRRS